MTLDPPEVMLSFLPDGAMRCTASTKDTGQCARRTRTEVNGNPMCGQHRKLIGAVGGLPVPSWPS